MSKLKRVAGDSFTARIFVAGDYQVAKEVCREYVVTGVCVQIKECDYIFTGGQESGVEVTLINYMRFPSCPEAITEEAILLAEQLIIRLHQLSASVVTDWESIFIHTDQKR